MARQLRQRAPTGNRRSTRRKNKIQISTLDNFVSGRPGPAFRPKSTTTDTRKSRARTQVNYDENSDEPEEWLEDAEEPKSTKRVKRNHPHPAWPKKTPFGGLQRQKTGGRNEDVLPAKVQDEITFLAAEPKVIPLWQSLPYAILVDILRYASFPFYKAASQDSGSVGWLLDVSTLCYTFHEAAIAVLLYSPPLYPAGRAHRLQALLDKPDDQLSIPYYNKIKKLEIEVKHLLIRASGIDLIQLINKTPLLKSLNLFHNNDQVGPAPWAQPSATSGKAWSYSESIFSALDDNHIHLEEWAWNGRFPNTPLLLQKMQTMNDQECLKHLKKLSLLNISALPRANDQTAATIHFIQGLQSLRELQHLHVESCTLFNDNVMAGLSFQLQSLSIVNCKGFTSDALIGLLDRTSFLLRRLDLKGNQKMDLGFTAALDEHCPFLQILELDMTYTDHSSFNDTEPHFDDAFPGGCMPTWPLALQKVTIENLRNLNAAEADNFLNSLVAAAPALNDLRKLSLRILLQKEGWRERARFRKEWQPKLEDVFLSRAPPPETFIRLPDLHRSSPIRSRPSTSDSGEKSSESPVGANQRKSLRIAKREVEHVLSIRQRAREAVVASSVEDHLSDDQDGMPRQRLCTEVHFHVDGQRPTGEQMTEADFLDDEVGGDSEYKE